MFSGIGFFHLAHGHDDPLSALNTELAQNPQLNDALLVLPEAFNLGRPYAEHGVPAIHREAILSALSGIHSAYKISFVVGLIEPDGKPFSSAYFVADGEPLLICHKATRDGADYDACSDPDKSNPVILPDAAIVTAICNDLSCAARCENLAKAALEAKKSLTVFCIPAAMYKEGGWFGGAMLDCPLYFPAKPYECHVVLANSYADGQGSFITDSAGIVRRRLLGDHRQKNQISIFPVQT